MRMDLVLTRPPSVISTSRVGDSDFFWNRTRRMGIEAAIMAVAGSAVPKMKRSTFIAAAPISV